MMEVYIDGVRVVVASLSEASRAWRRHVDETGIGVSGMKRHDGKVFVGKKLVARVSYNGRLWGADGREIAGETATSIRRA
jgi:DNA-directed RNA polymerase beta subunit